MSGPSTEDWSREPADPAELARHEQRLRAALHAAAEAADAEEFEAMLRESDLESPPPG